MCKLGLEKTEEPEIKVLIFVGSQNSREISTSASLTTLKPLPVWITTNSGKLIKRREYQIMLPITWKTCMQVKRKQLGWDMEQQTGSKLGKEYIRAVYCHPANLTFMQTTWCKMPSQMKHKMESRILTEYQQSQTCRWYHSNGRKWRGAKEPLDEGERGEWKKLA